MYDASSKRFLSADPIGGSVLKPELFNPYLYCTDDPINNIDPTGMYMKGDEALGLSPEQTAAIEVCSDAWFAAQASGDQDGMNAAHAAADAIRYGQSIVNMANSYVLPPPGMFPYYNNPPGAYGILVNAITVGYPKLTPEQVLKTADEWGRAVGILATSVKQPVNDGESKYSDEYKELVREQSEAMVPIPAVIYGVDPVVVYMSLPSMLSNLSLDEFIDVMGPVWEAEFSQRTTKDAIRELAICFGGLMIFVAGYISAMYLTDFLLLNYDRLRDAAVQGVSQNTESLSVKPLAENQKLNNIIGNLYKGQSNPNMIGNGTTMDAVRNELLTGNPTGGTFHSIKAMESMNGLNNLINSGILSLSDQSIANALIDDLAKALAGQ